MREDTANISAFVELSLSSFLPHRYLPEYFPFGITQSNHINLFFGEWSTALYDLGRTAHRLHHMTKEQKANTLRVWVLGGTEGTRTRWYWWRKYSGCMGWGDEERERGRTEGKIIWFPLFPFIVVSYQCNLYLYIGGKEGGKVLGRGRRVMEATLCKTDAHTYFLGLKPVTSLGSTCAARLLKGVSLFRFWTSFTCSWWKVLL